MKDEGGRMKDEGGRMKDESGIAKDEVGTVAVFPSSFILPPSSFGLMSPAPRFSALMSRIALIVLLARPASASIAVFTDGRAMKVSAFKAVDEQTMQLTMANGGSITVPLIRVDRIIDDEISTPEIVAEVKKIVEEGVFPRRSW